MPGLHNTCGSHVCEEGLFGSECLTAAESTKEMSDNPHQPLYFLFFPQPANAMADWDAVHLTVIN